MSVESFIAFRYLKAKRKQTFISFIAIINLAGVALGVAALIVVLAVMAGFEGALTHKMLGAESHVLIYKRYATIEQWEQTAARLKTVSGVVFVQPVVSGQVLARGYSGSSGAIVKGIEPELALSSGQFAEATVDPPRAVKELNYPERYPNPPVLLGSDLALDLGVSVGDTITLMSYTGRISPMGGRSPLAREFTIAGLVTTGVYNLDLSLLYMNLQTAQRFMDIGADVNALEIKVKDINQTDQILNESLTLLGERYAGYDWKQANYNLFMAMKLEKVVMFIIVTMTILVAAFNIVSTLIMVVMEKVKEIAILKSMGAARHQIMKIFLFQGFMIGALGTAIGLAAGLFLCFLLDKYQFIQLPPGTYLVDTLPVEVLPLHVLLTCFTAITVSLLATIYPAAYASRLDPVEALRYE